MCNFNQLNYFKDFILIFQAHSSEFEIFQQPLNMPVQTNYTQF